MNKFKVRSISIVMPAYNEGKTIRTVLDTVRDVHLIGDLQKELIVVDDCSTDNTATVVQQFIDENKNVVNLKYFRHEKNMGKGAALATGIKNATGHYLIIQDADLEYDPEEYNLLLKPIIDGRADVVYGSRFKGGNAHRILFFWHSIGNRFLTTLSNAFSNLNLSDMETGYKLFRSDVIKSIDLKEQRFGFEPEVTAKIARIPDIRIYEVGISYYGRTYREGKKINWQDALRASWCIFRYNLWRS